MSVLLSGSLNEERSLEDFFQPFRDNIIGKDSFVDIGERRMIRMLYADWTASGRCYKPIEEKLLAEVMPFIANTHTDSNYSSSFTTSKYKEARSIIRKHVNASDDDVLISYGSGMTDVQNKLQRILGLRVHTRYQDLVQLVDRPVVFTSHMEHHSNHTSWLETVCEVVVVPPDKYGLVSVSNFEEEISKYPNRLKYASITACSNVTGIETPYHEIARLIHRYDGYCFVDFACSAPYVHIDMHPDEEGYLDAITFSPHKFLGGPGSTGILVFNEKFCSSNIPDVSGGGTVDWTNPWGDRKYVEQIEEREDGGTPAIIQTIRAALAIQLKEEMGVANMLNREEELMNILWDGLIGISSIKILSSENRKRLGVISFCIDGIHYNEAVMMLNDHFGIQVRGGCSCAGTYGHYILGIGRDQSKKITDQIDQGEVSAKPGWVRLSIHPTMTNDEAYYILEAIREVSRL